MLMSKISLRLCFAVFVFAAANLSSAFGQAATASTNAPAATAPAPIPLASIVTSSQDALAKLQNDQGQISPDTTAASARDSLDEITRNIGQRLEIDRHHEQSRPTLGVLQSSQTAWQNIDTALNGTDGKGGVQGMLSTRVNEQHMLLSSLMTMGTTWKATLDSASANKIPAAILQNIQHVQDNISETTKALDTDLKDLYSLQIEAAKQSDRVKQALAAVEKSIGAAQARLFEQNQPILWNPAAFSSEGTGMVGRERASLGVQFAFLQTYMSARSGSILIHVVLLMLLIATFYWIRNAIAEKARTDSSLADAKRVFGAPLSTALLMALVASNWLYPPTESGRLLWSIIGAVALVPTVIIVRRLVTAEVMPLLYAMMAAYIVDQVRNTLTPDGTAARFLLLLEMTGACFFILGALRSQKLAAAEGRAGVEKLVRGYLHAAFFIMMAAAVASFLGYLQMAELLGNNALNSSYLAISFYAGVRILDALLLAFLSMRPLSTFGMVRHHHDLVYAKTSGIIRWIVTAIWAVIALSFFSLRNPLFEETEKILNTTPVPFGTFKNLQVWAILAFPLIVWLAFALSRFARFALEEDVFPNLNLPRGIPYAISTMVHYAILVVGFFIALNAVGIDLGNYAVLAGAFGVGLGFGLQNIMNNFISGLILLFERPIKVGDTVQIDANTIGRVERIGIRASVILLTNGSELIMPNGNLISNPVTNWTLSNCERLIEIPVNVGPTANVQHVLDLLVAAARANSSVLKNPAPSAIVIAIAAASTSVKLRCWIDSEEVDWAIVTTELTLAVQAALQKENIAIV
jgi:small-conductance mechanosensitive channel